MANLVVFLLIVAMVVVMVGGLAIWRGFVLTQLWTWFIVPTFNAPRLSIAVAIGICLVVGMFSHKQYNEDEKEDTTKTLVNAFLSPLITLLIGYIVTLFM
jgi:hypothetical protein